VREYIVDGTIKIIFVTSRDNKADIFTKNVTLEIYEEHIDDYLIQHQVIKTTMQDLKKFKLFDSGGVSEIHPGSTSGINESNDLNKSTINPDKGMLLTITRRRLILSTKVLMASQMVTYSSVENDDIFPILGTFDHY
jgi:hypothetical protein